MKHQSYIRSLFVAFCAFFVCVSAVAGELNPFAYRLDNMAEKNGANLSNDYFEVKYSLSGPATSVVVRLWDATASTWTRDGGNTGTCLAKFPLTGNYLQKGAHTYRIDFTDVIGQGTSLHGKKVRWTVDVMGGNQSDEYYTKNCTIYNETALNTISSTPQYKQYKFINAVEVTENKGFRYPTSVDICNDPYDYNFGAVFCVESRVSTGASGNDKTSYVSYDESPGVYVFGGGMERLWANYHEKNVACYGANFKSAEHFVSNDARLSALAPHRVRITDDGRVFVSVAEGRNNILKQITNPSNIDRVDQNGNGDYDDGGNFYEPDRNGGQYTDIFNGGSWVAGKLILNTTTGVFIASPNSGMDVRNSGENLELLLLSANIETNNNYTANPSSGTIYPGINQGEWHLSRYKLGTNTTWGNNKTTEEILNTIKTQHGFANTNELTQKVQATNGTKLGDAMFVGFNWCSVEYDPNGGCWVAQYRGINPVAATLVHYNATTKRIDHEEHMTGRNSGGIRHNHNFSKLVVPGGYPMVKYFSYKEGGTTYTIKGTHAVDGYLTVYSTSYQNGTSSLSDFAYIENANAGSGAHDFAWDFADNLYVASTGSNKLIALALPHKDKEVSTPCMEKFNYALSPVYNFEVEVLPASYATITHERIGKAPYPHYLHNAKMDLRADVVAGCKFYQWTGQSTGTTSGTDGCKLLINSLTKNEAITANVGLCVYEDKKILGMTSETTFPAAFVQRELDDVSYSTICLPFHLESLEGTPYQGASVLKFTSEEQSNVDGDNRISLNFTEVEFGAGKGMRAGKPYLIKVATPIKKGEEHIFNNVTCPPIGAEGQSVTNLNGTVTFHALLNLTTFDKDQVKDKLFLTADNRLVSLYGQDSFTINGLRGYFIVSGEAQNVEYMLNLPEKVVTSTPMVNIADSLQVTKYLWDGKIYIQRGNEVYDLSGARVK